MGNARLQKYVCGFLLFYIAGAGTAADRYGATADLGLMWNIAETFNGLMAIPNLIALFLLSGTVVKLTKAYFAQENP